MTWDWKAALRKAKGDPANVGAAETKVFNLMAKEIGTLRQQQKLTMNEGDSISGTADSLQLFQKRFETLQETVSNFAKQGYGLDDSSSNFSQAMNAAIATSDRFLHNLKAGPAAMAALSDGIGDGQFEIFVETLGETAGLLATNAASLQKLGLGMRSFAKNVDIMTYSFNAQQSQIESVNQRLFDFAKEVKQLPSVVSRNFQTVATQLAYPVKTIENEFRKIQEMSAKTGVSVNKLMGSFGQQSDTISGASSFASGLNTILGKNVFSATQVLMMSESDRMNATRDALKDSQIYKDYTSGDDKLKKFALRAISGKVGMSLDETRRFLDGGDPKGTSVKDQMANETSDRFKKAGSKLTDAVVDLAAEIGKNATLINEKTRYGTERDLAFNRQEMLDSLRKNPKSEMGDLMKKRVIAGFTKDLGPKAGGQDVERLFDAAGTLAGNQKHRTGIVNQAIAELQRTLELAEGEPFLAKSFEDLLAGDSRSGMPSLEEMIQKRPAEAIMAMKSFRKTGKSLTAALTRGGGTDTRLSPEERSFLEQQSKGRTRIEKARLLRQLRGGNHDKKIKDGASFNFGTNTFQKSSTTTTDGRTTFRDSKVKPGTQRPSGQPAIYQLIVDGEVFLSAQGRAKLGEEAARQLSG